MSFFKQSKYARSLSKIVYRPQGDEISSLNVFNQSSRDVGTFSWISCLIFVLPPHIKCYWWESRDSWWRINSRLTNYFTQISPFKKHFCVFLKMRYFIYFLINLKTVIYDKVVMTDLLLFHILGIFLVLFPLFLSLVGAFSPLPHLCCIMNEIALANYSPTFSILSLTEQGWGQAKVEDKIIQKYVFSCFGF